MVTLCILDGFGINESEYGNAIKLSETKNLDALNVYPTTTLVASGTAVGLPEGQMGNSEVGHLNLGAGRVVYQDSPRINKDILDGTIKDNLAFNEVIDHVLKEQSDLHLMGLLSSGGVHSHIDHLKALIDLAHDKGVGNIYIHAIMDGRDTLRDSGLGFVRDIEEYCQGRAKIATICGRVYTMDRENRWDRIKKAYDMLVYGIAENNADTATDAVKQSYESGVYDEFIEPTIVRNVKVKDNDGFIFFNFRTDRAREITRALVEDDFNEFDRKKLNNLIFCTMTEYSSDFKRVIIAYPPEHIENNLSAVISQKNKKQFHVSETTKYAHVTFFFNGGIEKPYKGEERKLIESVNVKDFSDYPSMRAREITNEVVKAIRSRKYDFLLVNISNPDMLGHTGKLNSTIEAIKVVDECVGIMAQTSLECGDDLIITADHGNCENMLDERGQVLTSHTSNPVPLWLVSDRYKNVKLKTGKLCNVAPTVLKCLGIDIPDYMDEPLF